MKEKKSLADRYYDMELRKAKKERLKKIIFIILFSPFIIVFLLFIIASLLKI